MGLPVILSGAANCIPSSNVSATSFRSGYPIANVRNRYPSLTWRSNSTVDGILIDHRRETTVDAIALINSNLTSGATLTFKRGSTVDCVDVTEVLTPGSDDIFKFITPSRYQYSKLELSDALNADLFLEIGCLWAGVRERLTYGFADNFSFLDSQVFTSHINSARVSQAEYLNEYVRFQLTFDALEYYEAGALIDLWKVLKGRSLPLFFIPDRDAVEGYWCRIMSIQRVVSARDSFQVELEEWSRG